MAQGATEYMSRLERQEAEEAAKRKRYRLKLEHEAGPDSMRMARCVTSVALLAKSREPVAVSLAPWLWDMMKDWRNYELDVTSATIRTVVSGQRVEVFASHRGAPIRAAIGSISVESRDSSGDEEVNSDTWDWSSDLVEIAP